MVSMRFPSVCGMVDQGRETRSQLRQVRILSGVLDTLGPTVIKRKILTSSRNATNDSIAEHVADGL